MVAIIIVAIVAAAWLLMQPGVLENIVYALAIIVAAIIVIAIVAYVAMALIAVPMYAYKGEQYQEGVDYNLDDVNPVEGKEDKDEQR